MAAVAVEKATAVAAGIAKAVGQAKAFLGKLSTLKDKIMGLFKSKKPEHKPETLNDHAESVKLGEGITTQVDRILTDGQGAVEDGKTDLLKKAAEDDDQEGEE